MTLRIAVVGGGICGLAAAGFLRRAGLAVTVYEQATQISEIGAGLVVPPNAVRLVRRLGGFERLQDVAVPLEVGWEFRRWQDGTVLFAQRLGADCERLFGEPCFTAHRADLLDILLAAAGEPAPRLAARCVAVRHRPDHGDVELAFADGSTATADVVIGADGTHSVVRDAVMGTTPGTPAATNGAPPTTTPGTPAATNGAVRFSGVCAYRCLVPADRAPGFALRPVQTLWLGPGHHLVHYPISGGRYVNLVAFAPARDWRIESWTAEGKVEDLRAEFEGWDPQLTKLVDAAERTGRWALLDRDPLPAWTNGPITVAGDAAHPMFPFLGQGAAQAIEDGAVLAACLAGCGTGADAGPDAGADAGPDAGADAGPDAGADAGPAAALRRYEELRKPRTTQVQLLSHTRLHSNHLPDGPEQQARDATFAAQDPLSHNAWIYGHDAEMGVAELSR